MPRARLAAVSLFSVGTIVDEILDRHAGGVIVWVGNASGNLRRSIAGWAARAWGRWSSAISTS